MAHGRRIITEESYSGCNLGSEASLAKPDVISPSKSEYHSERQKNKEKFSEFRIGESALRELEREFISIDKPKAILEDLKTPIAPPVTEIKTDFDQEVDELIRDFQRFKILPRVFKALKVYSDVQKDLRVARSQY